MNEQALNTALSLLGEFLAERGSAPVWLVIGGGSALLAQGLSARPTKDVDVMALREWEGNVVSAYPHPKIATLLQEIGHADLAQTFP